jgi:hypothetical protein
MTDAPTGPRPRRRWIWVLVALATAAVVVVPVTLRIALKAAIHHEFGPAVIYRRDVTALKVQTDAGGSVMIRPGRDGRVTITRTLQWVFGKPSVTQSWQDGVLRVAASCPRFDPFEDCEASVTITVPAGTAVTAQAGSGSVVVTGMSGPLHLAATSGLLRVGRVSGPLWLSATSGFVAGRTGILSRTVYASVTTGSIALRLDAEPRLLTVGVRSGYANVMVPRGARYRVAGSYGPGILQIAPGLSDASSGRLLTATLGTGVVRIGYAPAPDTPAAP